MTNKKKQAKTKTNNADSDQRIDGDDSLSKETDIDSERENAIEEKVLLETIKSLEEKILRAHAEVENIRRNSQKEVVKARVYSAELIVKDLLSPIDNLFRSLEHSDKEIPRTLVELVLKEISQALTNNNIEEIDPIGSKFDPNFHEALSVKEDKLKEADEILEVIQKGYKIQERIIRPALVIVNKI